MRLKLALATVLLLCGLSAARAESTVRIAWYSDGNEGEVLRDLLKRFEATTPGIHVIVDQVPYKAIGETIPVQLASGQGPDMVRVTDFGGVARYLLDLRPYLSNPGYWEKNFGPFLEWMRAEGDTSSIPGFMTQLTVTAPFVNKTLFDQAGVDFPGRVDSWPGPKATWDQWAEAAQTVAGKVGAPFPIAIDRSGHRVFGPMISEGAAVFDDAGAPAVVDGGFKRMAKRLYDWHQSGVMGKELWSSVSGATYRGANDEFKNGQVVLYMSGSWQIAQFDKTIGNAFDWIAVPNPCGPAACSGMPGGAGLVATKSTKDPKAVAAVMEYLASEPVLREFYSRCLFVPGHLGLATQGIDYPTASAPAKAALSVFSRAVRDVSPLAYRLQGHPYSRIIFNVVISRLGQAIAGEGSLEDAYKRITQDIAQQIAERKKS